MQSKVTFDLDTYNLPILKLEINSTSDVRDKIAKRFVEALGHTSKWCIINPVGENEWQIWAVRPEEMREVLEDLSQKVKMYEERQSPVAG